MSCRNFFPLKRQLTELPDVLWFNNTGSRPGGKIMFDQDQILASNRDDAVILLHDHSLSHVLWRHRVSAPVIIYKPL